LAKAIILVLALSLNTYAKDESEISFRDGVKYINHTANGKWENTKTLSCSLVQTIGINQKNPNGYLENPGAVFVDQDDFIYISDYSVDKLKIYDKNCNLCKVISKNNLKEYDFKRPGSVMVDSKKNIYIKCSKINKIYVFNFERKFLESIDTPRYSCGLRYQPDTNEKFVYISYFANKSDDPNIRGPIVPLKNNRITLPSFGNQLQTDPRMNYVAGATIACKTLNKGRIVIAYLYPFEVHIYSTNSDLKMVITRNDPLFTETCQYRGLLFTRRRLRCIIPFPDGKFMIAYLDRGEDWIENVKKGDFANYPLIVYDLYNSEGIFLQQFMQPQNLAGLLYYADYKGFVYEKSYPKYSDKAGRFVINKYRVEFKDK